MNWKGRRFVSDFSAISFMASKFGRLKSCPICGYDVRPGYACGDFYVSCSLGCPSPMCDHPDFGYTFTSWNDWVEWYIRVKK